jgi:hypothetical protein
MAQTKTKKAKGSSKSRDSGNGAKAQAARKPKATKRPRPKRSSNGSKATSHNGIEGGAKAARDAVRGAGKDAAHVASKAKIPLLAGGAALVGTVGGVVIGSTHSGDKVLGISLPKRKRVRISSKDLAKAAKKVGHLGNNVGELSAELRRVRQGLASDDDERQSSPLEVLLKGLTTRR